MFNKKLKLRIKQLEEEIAELRENFDADTSRIHQRLNENQEEVNRLNDFEVVFKDCVELNQRVKKMEEYLKIKYVVEGDAKLFIGYKKK